MDLAMRRLRAQRLIGEPFPSPVEAVRWFGAVQSQDYTGARWALGMRSRGATEAQVDRLFDEGAILRTHVMRPTWHFVLPEDFHWLAQLTGPRVLASLRGRHRQLEIDERVISAAETVFATALAGGRHLTRPQLGQVLSAAGIAPDGQRLPHLILAAELHGVVASGARRGKQLTYALAAERAPRARSLAREEALVELTKRYFRSHGPAQLPDLAWWSGLTLADAKAGVDLAGEALRRELVDGKEYWFDAHASTPGSAGADLAHLLPNFDEYTVAYRDRSGVLEPGLDFDPSLFSFGSILANVVTVRGRVRGGWRRSQVTRKLQLEIRLLSSLRPGERRAVEAAAERMSRFLEREVEVGWLNG